MSITQTPPPFPVLILFSFDPNLAMMAGMRFPVPLMPEEVDIDENGNVNWHQAWLKEIGHLQQVTAEQEKAGADQEWFKMMLVRVRTALMPMPPPMLGPDGAMLPVPPHMMPPPVHDEHGQMQGVDPQQG